MLAEDNHCQLLVSTCVRMPKHTHTFSLPTPTSSSTTKECNALFIFSYFTDVGLQTWGGGRP